MVDYTSKAVINRNFIRCATNVKCDVCGKDCVVAPINDNENNGIKYSGIVHAFQVKYGYMYDPDLREEVYVHEDDCCSTECVFDLLNDEYYDGKTLLEFEDKIKIKNVTHYIVKENETMDNKISTQTEVARLIWDIAKISPEHGNAIIDIIGDKAYDTVMTLANEETKNE